MRFCGHASSLSSLLLSVGLLAGGLAFPGAGNAATSAPSLRAGAEKRIQAEFGRICERLSRSNDYFGDAQVAPLRVQLAAAAASASPDSARVAELRNALAYHLIRLGRLEDALELFAQIPARSSADFMVAGMAELALAEDQNCLQVHGGGVCVLPLTDAAVHRQPERARAAAAHFLEVLRREPDQVQARWLFQLAHALSGAAPDELDIPPRTDGETGNLQATHLTPSKAGSLPWLDVAHRLGIEGADLAGGAVVDDFDGDGRLDVITSTMDPCGPMRAWRNTGSGFADVAESWGLASQLGGLNLVHADYDGDGALDLLVLRGGWMGNDGRIRNSLLRNDLAATGRFVDETVKAGLAQPAYPTQAAAWADADLDGDLDLFVANESPTGSADPLSLTADAPGFPSQLFLNQGNGRFRDVARGAGVQNLSFAKGAAWGDFDNDGDADLYISNIGANRLYRNDGTAGDGTPLFTDMARELGVAAPQRTFATWWFDFDDDGDLDLFVARYSSDVEEVTADLLGLRQGYSSAAGRPLLFRNDREGGTAAFTEVGAALGFDATLLPMGANFGDLDADGALDIYLGTGVPRFDGLMPNVALRNVEGRRFENVTFSNGLGHLQKGHGVAFGDLDNDGDEDLFEQLGGAFPYDAFDNALYLNPTIGGASQPALSHERTRHWVVLQLRSETRNRYAVGARVELVVKEAGERRRTLHRTVSTGGSFGGSSLQLEIGLGTAEHIERLHVAWPSLKEPRSSTFEQLAVDRVYRIDRERSEPTVIQRPAIDFRRARQTHHPP